ncbi:MFS transporter [Christensenella hongkongensis]|uniref:MFS transporter n=2 Tax=Christensenella hongkongensis TaxID=270498 RepID=UPI00062392A7|nr:MFS transporter [Christensenella hongkongensis]TCW28239.1 putative MFS family arabinose efflux permease [Christensenella hongkongensis]
MKKLILLITTCFFWFSLYLYLPFLTPFLISLGVSATLAGIIFGIHSITQLVLRFPIGIKSDQLGKQKPFIILGMLFSAIASIVMYFFPSPAMLFVGNAVSGFSSTMYVAFTVLYAKYYDKTQTNKAMGTIGAVVEVGILLSFLIGGALYQNAGIRSLFFISFCVAAAGTLISFFVKEVPDKQVTIKTNDLLKLVKNKQLIISSVLCIIIKAVVFATAFSFTPKIAQDIGANGIEVGVINAMFIAASVLGSLFITTKAGMRLGNTKTSVLGFLILGLYSAAVPFVHNIPVFMLVQFIGGLGYASLTAIFMANAIKHLNEDQKAAGMGLYQALYSAGSAAGPVILGIFADSFSYAAGFIAIAVVALGGMALSIGAGARKLMD